MTRDTSPSLDPPFVIPMGLELRHLVDACEDAAELRGQEPALRYAHLTGRFVAAADQVLMPVRSKLDFYDSRDLLRRTRAVSFLCNLPADQFVWVAERAAAAVR